MKKFINIACFGLEWVIRFIRGTQVFGIKGAFNVFIRSNRRARFRNNHSLIQIPLFNSSIFNFRRGLDHQVLPQFYEREYYIDTQGGGAIRFIIDAGANIGSQSMRLHLLYPSANIISIEAEAGNFSILERNFANIPEVRLLNGALWSTDGFVNIMGDPLEPVSFSVVEAVIEKNKVQAYSVENVLQKFGWTEIDIFKIDIEGAEYEVFSRNSQSWLDKVKCFIIEVPDNDRPGTMQLIYEQLGQRKFNSYYCGENLVLIRADIPWTLKIIRGLSVN